MGYPNVALMMGTTQIPCERCRGPGNANHSWEVSITTRDGVTHKYCKPCLGIIVENYEAHRIILKQTADQK